MIFYPNCTVPIGSVPYVAAPNVRSTLEILWTSLATLIACTYSVLHLNVPQQRRGRDRGWRGDLKWTWRRTSQYLKWTLITLLAPEYVLLVSMAEWWNARVQLKKLHKSIPETVSTWTMTHMLFADMGGFVVQYGTQKPASLKGSDQGPHNSPAQFQSPWDGGVKGIIKAPETVHSDSNRRIRSNTTG